jgi:hypothetical protein
MRQRTKHGVVRVLGALIYMACLILALYPCAYKYPWAILAGALLTGVARLVDPDVSFLVAIVAAPVALAGQTLYFEFGLSGQAVLAITLGCFVLLFGAALLLGSGTADGRYLDEDEEPRGE